MPSYNERLTANNLKIDEITTLANSLPDAGGDVKLFETVIEMQADPNPQEGDLAIVYREETSENDQTEYYFEGLYEYSSNSYSLVPSQLDATQSNVYQGTFYGANGVQTGTLTTDISSIFTDTNAEVYAKIQAYYNSLTPRVLTDQDKMIDTNTQIIPCKSDGTPLLDTSSVTAMSYMFQNCSSLVTIPLLDTSSVTTMQHMFYNCPSLTSIPLLDTSSVNGSMLEMFGYCDALVSIPLLDTSNVTTMQSMFQNCSSLVTVPILNTSSTTNMRSMFAGCTSLSNTSLNNILAMCTNSAVTSRKTLKAIGLTNEQATTCTTLSNYQAFLDAGWSTGY